MLEGLARQLGLTEQLQNQFPLVAGSQCAADLQAFGAALQEQQIWALQSKHLTTACPTCPTCPAGVGKL